MQSRDTKYIAHITVNNKEAKITKGENIMGKTKDAKKSSTAQVKVDNARIDRLKEQHMSTPAVIRTNALHAARASSAAR
jgi:hypothetical protein